MSKTRNGPKQEPATRDFQTFEFQSRLSGLLKSLYGSVEKEAIPERFIDLLERLDQAEQNQSAGKSGASAGKHSHDA